MRSILTLIFSVAFVVVLAGCGPKQPAAETKPAETKPAEQKPADTTEQKPADQPVTPLVEAAKEPDKANTVDIKAVDSATGKVVDLIFKPIYFDFDKYNIKPEFQGAIESNAAMVKEASALKLVIEGHCDERGTTEYNLALGQRRAVAVMNAMVAAGASKGQLKTISYGKERPVDTGHTEAAWAKNRRSVMHKNEG